MWSFCLVLLSVGPSSAVMLEAGEDVVVKYDHRVLPRTGVVELALAPVLRDGGGAVFGWDARGIGEVEFDFEVATGVGVARFSAPGDYMLTVGATVGGVKLEDDLVVRVLSLPVAKWRFDEAEGTVIGDYSTVDAGRPAGRYPGVSDSLGGAHSWVPGAGVAGGAMRFTREEAGAVAFAAEPGSSPGFSVGLRIRPEAMLQAHVIDKFPDGDGGSGWAVTLDADGGLHFLIGSQENFTDLHVADAYALGEWRHVLCAYQGATADDPGNSRAEIYIDGERREVVASHRSALGLVVVDGCRLPTQMVDGERTILRMGTDEDERLALQYVGLLDDVAIYPAMLTAGQVCDVARVPSAPTDIGVEFSPGGDAFLRLSAVDEDVCEEHAYGLVEGAGDTHNGAFEVVGNLVYWVEPVAASGRMSISMRVRATDKDGLRYEKVIGFFVEPYGSGGDLLVRGGDGSYGFVVAVVGGGGASSPSTSWWLDYAGESPAAGALVGGGVTVDVPWSRYAGGFVQGLVAGAGDGDNGRFSVESLPGGRFAIFAAEPLDLAGDRKYSLRVGARDSAGVVTPTAVEISAVRLHLNEFVARNRSSAADEDGNASDWIELHNASAAAVHLGGWALSNDPMRLGRWPLPPGWLLEAGGYEVVFASGKARSDGRQLHLDSTLKDGGCEYLALAYPALGHVATQHAFVPALGKDDAYGLVADDPAQRGPLASPTPGAPNPPVPTPALPAPELSVASGYFEEPFELFVGRGEGDADSVLRFTLDGADPDEDSARTDGTLLVDGLAVLKVRAFRDGYTPSVVVARTYLFLDDVLDQEAMVVAQGGLVREGLVSLPAMVITVDEGAMFGDAGIYDRPDLDGEIGAGVEFFAHPDSGLGDVRFASPAGLRLSGRRSLEGSPKHALRLTFRKKYGEGKLDSGFLGDGLGTRFDDLVWRAAFNQSWVHADGEQRGRAQNLRDRFARETHLEMGRLSPHSRLVHLYINGRYWGIYEPTELPDDLFQSAYFKCPQMEFDTVDAGEVEDGGRSAQEDWDSLVTMLREGNLADPAEYAEVLGALDMEDFIDFVLLQTYLGNLNVGLMGGETWVDDNNYFAGRHNGGKWGWRFFVWDAEETMVGLDDNFLRMPGRPAALLKLMRNRDFRVAFADRVFVHLFEDGALTAARSGARYAALADEIDLAMYAEAARWGWVRRPGEPYDHADWERERARLSGEYLPQRTAVVLEQLELAGLYPGIAPPGFVFAGDEVVMVAPLGEIYYTLDGSDPRLPGGGVAPAAKLYDRAVALGVSGSGVDVMARAVSNRGWSALRVEHFPAGPEEATSDNFKLTEIMFSGDVQFLEFWNPGGVPVSLAGLVSNDSGMFEFSGGAIVGPGGYVLVVGDVAAFEAAYGGGLPLAGVFEGMLPHSGRVRVRNRWQVDILDENYATGGGWPIAAAKLGFSLVPDVSSPTGWRASAFEGGSPGGPDPAVLRPGVVVNELMSDPLDGGEDAVELRNLMDVPVVVGGWFLTDKLDREEMYRLPDETVVPAGGYLVVRPDDFGFGFSKGGDQVHLMGADDSGRRTGYVHGFKFGAAPPGVTRGRVVDSTGAEHFPLMAAATMGGANSGPLLSGLIVNEVMYQPDVPRPPDPPELDGGGEVVPPLLERDLEFVELRNVSDRPLGLGGGAWLADGDPLPQGLELAPGELLLLTAGDALRFRHHYRVPENVQVIGGRRMSLGNSRGSASVAVAIGEGTGIYGELDAVVYADEMPWPRSAGGDGHSLERVAPAGFAPDPLSWAASCSPGGTPGRLRELSFDEWRAEWFGAAELDDPAVSGESGDANGNGIVNLLEYAFGSDPKGAGQAGRPTAGFEGGALVFRFRRRVASQRDIGLRLEESGDLSRWRDVPAARVLEERVRDNRDGSEEVSWVLGQGGDRFLRLSVSLLR